MNDGEGQAQRRSGQEGQAQEEVTCTVCGRIRSAHIGFHHVFSEPGTRVDTSQFARKRPTRHDARDSPDEHVIDAPKTSQATLFADGVLRQALIAKGVLTLEDLQDAEKAIQAITGAILGVVE